MKALTLVTFALFTSTSLFASDVVSAPNLLGLGKGKVVVSESESGPDYRALLPRGAHRPIDSEIARASAKFAEIAANVHERNEDEDGEGEGEVEINADAAICLQEQVPAAYEGSTCLGNLYLGLLNLAAHECEMSAADVQEARGECGL